MISELFPRNKKMQIGSESSQISFVVLTHNEEWNLDACLHSVAGWAGEIFIVDSGSTDRTLEIAEQYDARVFTHPFETHSTQWQWALKNLPISTEWVLALDADQRVTPELRNEISNLLRSGDLSRDHIVGGFIKRRQIFRGRWIKYGGYYPKYLLKLFRRDQVWVDENDLVDHHFRVRGSTLKLENDIVEDNQKESDISVWIAKHNRYATLQARENMSEFKSVLKGSFRGSPDERILWSKRIWYRLPLYFRPCLYFFYRYIFRLGFLDGKEGFIFHFLQGFWYRLLVDINLDDLRRRQAERNQQDQDSLKVAERPSTHM